MKFPRLMRRRKQREQELDQEIRAHLAMAIREQIERGENPAEAEANARREFGNTIQVKEVTREMWGSCWLETLLQDLRYGVRQLRRNPGFTAVAVITLALGIGVNTSVFSFLDAVAIRPLAVPEAAGLTIVRRGDANVFSHPNYEDYRDRNQTFTALAASMPTQASLDFEGQSDLITAEAVSGNYESVMRVPLLLGHWFTDEDQPDAVISYRVWVEHFHSDPRALGRQVRSVSARYTIVGVAPADFTGVWAPRDTDLWVPLHFWAKQFPGIEQRLRNRASPTVMIFGRLRPGVTNAQAAANLNGVDARIRKRGSGGLTAPLAVRTVRGLSDIRSRDLLLPIIWLFAAVAALVLLIACTNIGNLLLARGAARRRELAVRVAFGARRLRLVRQLLTECFLLASLGGLGGLVLGAWTNRLMGALLPTLPIHVSLRLSVDIRVVAFAVVATVATLLLAGLLPAWRSTRTDVYSTLKGEANPHQQFRLRQASLVTQVAVSLLLLVCAGLFLRSISRLRAVNTGFAIKNRLYAWTFISRPEFTPKTGRRFYSQVVKSLRGLPGVQDVALTHFLPLLVDTGSECVSNGAGPQLRASHGTIGPGYLKTMQIPLLEGRAFTPTDGPSSPPVVIINETLAQHLWPHRTAAGRRILIGCRHPNAATVVGVARDSKTLSLSEAPHPYFYQPFLQHYPGLATIVIQTAGDPRAMMGAVRRTLVDESKSVRIFALDTLASQVKESYWETRWEASLLTIFGLLALGLAAVGLHGVVAYWVNLRTHDIGIRVALGAQKHDVLRLVVGQGLTLALVGVGIGVAVALALTRFLSSLLYGVKPMDPVTFVAATLVLIAVALIACYIPARRAARVDPMIALRHE